MKIKWKTLIICILIPLAVGGLAALISRGAMKRFELVAQPPLSPPGWLFPVVWTILYTLMGIASYLVLTEGGVKKLREGALKLYGVQLAFNFLWTIFFFNLAIYRFSFVWLLILWGLIWGTVYLFGKSSKTAARLMIPYLLWVAFAGYLNLGVAILN